MRYLLLLILQTCVLLGICIFRYSIDIFPGVTSFASPYILVGAYIGVCLVYLFLKWLIYSFLGWIFFDASRVSQWLESYSTLLYYLGFALFPYVLLLIYFDLNVQLALIIGVFLFGLVKISMFYKWIKLFCNNLYGSFLLILYFCALEIIPCLLLYQGLRELNNILVIKF